MRNGAAARGGPAARHRLTTAAWLAVCLVLGALPRAQASWAGATADAAPASSRATRTQLGFRTPELLAEHYRKHGSEFGHISMAEYLRLALELRDRPKGGDVLELVRRDSVTCRFDRRSGAFIAFGAQGVIRTFFRPREGERYFRRQVIRDRR